MSRPADPRGRSGRIGGHRAAIMPTRNGMLLRIRRREWLLPEVIVRHRDDGGAVRFTVEREGAVEFAVEYRRCGPTAIDHAWMAIDFTSDEPWDWEDRDFGRFVFAVATATGPLKYRWVLDHPARPEHSGTPHEADERGLRRGAPWGLSRQEVEWEDLCEVRVKFEVGSIWAEHSLLVAHGHRGLCTLPLMQHVHAVPAARHYLRSLPGWDDAAEAAIEDAVAYAEHWGTPDHLDGELDDRCERPVWSR